MKNHIKNFISFLIVLTVCFSTITVVHASSRRYYNRPPTLTVESVYTLTEGQSFGLNKQRNLIKEATDWEDARNGKLALLGNVRITSRVNPNRAGTYYVTFKLTDRSGDTVTKTTRVIVRERRSNTSPVLEVLSSFTLNEGDSFGLNKQMTLVQRATDREDGNLMNKVKVRSSNVNPKRAGTYSITFEVTDSAGATVTKTTRVIVRGRQPANTPPVLDVLPEYTLTVGQSFGGAKQMTLVRSATDREDGNLTNRVIVRSSNVNPKVVGTYSITFEVTDNDGATVTKTTRVIVRGRQPANTPPVLEVEPVFRLTVGQSFGGAKQMTLVKSATDREDGDLMSKVKVKSSNVNPKARGTYSITFEVTDSAGATVEKTTTVSVM